MVRILFVVLLVALAFGCRPRSTPGAELPPQCTLAPPQDTLAYAGAKATCRCAAGEPCVCGSGCSCPACGCAACPGKSLPPGVASGYEAALKSAAYYRSPLVAFIGTPARPVEGCVSYALDSDGNPRVWAGRTANDGVTLDVLATDEQIRAAVAPRPTVTLANALAAPPMPAWVRGGNCGPGG